MLHRLREFARKHRRPLLGLALVLFALPTYGVCPHALEAAVASAHGAAPATRHHGCEHASMLAPFTVAAADSWTGPGARHPALPPPGAAEPTAPFTRDIRMFAAPSSVPRDGSSLYLTTLRLRI